MNLSTTLFFPHKKFLLFLKKHSVHILLFLIICTSLFFNLYNISSYSYGNEYYAASIKSMSENFKNFFFVSYDPAGMVSIDKPPLGFWIQTISVLIFGYNGFAMLLPQALAGTASCFMIYILISKYFSKTAGLISAFVFAITPATVVASRNNTVDMQLIFDLLLAVYFLFKSIDNRKPKYLYVSGILIGIGFNIKMLQAYMYLPAFCIVYLIFAKDSFRKKIFDGIVTSIIMLSISFSWALFVDFYSKDNRPYVGSSTNNSVIELIVGHNGLERLSGSQSRMQTISQDSSIKNVNKSHSEKLPENNKNMPSDSQKDKPEMRENKSSSHVSSSENKNASGGRDSISTASPLRLWSSELFGQIGWLITFVFFGIISYIKKFNFKNLSMKDCVFTFWSICFITLFIFFSFAGYFHRYYLCMMAPCISSLFGISLEKMISDFKSGKSFKCFLLILAFFISSAISINYLYTYSELRNTLFTVCLTLILSTFILLMVNYWKINKILLRISAVLIFISLNICPLYWSFTPLKYVPSNFGKPYAGPELEYDNSNNKQKTSLNINLQDYLVKNYKKGSFLITAKSASNINSFIINTGLPAYAYGGFSGSDNSLTLEKLKQYIKNGKITYFLVSDKNQRNSDIINYVKENAKLIDPSEYGESYSQSSLYLFNN